MEALLKLYSLPLLSKVIDLTHKAAGLRDVDLADYLVSMARQSDSLDNFQNQLEEDEADFPVDLIHAIYALVEAYPLP